MMEYSFELVVGFVADALHQIRGTSGKHLYAVPLSAMLFYTYCLRVHYYILGFLCISSVLPSAPSSMYT